MGDLVSGFHPPAVSPRGREGPAFSEGLRHAFPSFVPYFRHFVPFRFSNPFLTAIFASAAHRQFCWSAESSIRLSFTANEGPRFSNLEPLSACGHAAGRRFTFEVIFGGFVMKRWVLKGAVLCFAFALAASGEMFAKGKKSLTIYERA